VEKKCKFLISWFRGTRRVREHVERSVLVAWFFTQNRRCSFSFFMQKCVPLDDQKTELLITSCIFSLVCSVCAKNIAVALSSPSASGLPSPPRFLFNHVHVYAHQSWVLLLEMPASRLLSTSSSYLVLLLEVELCWELGKSKNGPMFVLGKLCASLQATVLTLSNPGWLEKWVLNPKYSLHIFWNQENLLITLHRHETSVWISRYVASSVSWIFTV
jgi:hypothetical protein